MTFTHPNPHYTAEKLDQFEADLLAGKVFRRTAASGRSVIGYRPPAGARTYAALVQSLATAARDDQTAALVAAALACVSPTTTGENMVAGAATGIAAAIEAGFTDKIGMAGPEAGSPSDHQSTYSLRPLVEVCAALNFGSPDFHSGYGWTLEALIERTGATVQRKP